MDSISVVLTTHNRMNLLPRALRSIIAQSHQPDQVIIVDDGSTDQTRAMVAQDYPGFDYSFQANQGISKARNTGILKARSEWIAFLDDDDEWLPDKLKKQLEYIADHAEAKLVHVDELWIRNGKPVRQMKKHRKRGGMIFQYCLPLCCISPSAAVVHRSVFEHVGMFDESLPACEDYDMWLRIAARYPIAFIDEALIKKYGGHVDQLSRKHWGMDRFRIFALDKILNDVRLAPDDYHAAVAMLMDKIRIYLNGAKKHHNSEHVRHFQALLNKYVADAH